MQYRIEKNTVQETLLIPVYGRKMCTELYPNLYRDETAVRLFGEIDYDFSALEKKSRSLMQRFGFLEVAMRQNALAFEVRDYLRAHPNAAVVNLGCGLDATGRSCDNGSCKLYNLDFPDVIRVRDALLPAGPRVQGSLKDAIRNICCIKLYLRFFIASLPHILLGTVQHDAALIICTQHCFRRVCIGAVQTTFGIYIVNCFLGDLGIQTDVLL